MLARASCHNRLFRFGCVQCTQYTVDDDRNPKTCPAIITRTPTCQRCCVRRTLGLAFPTRCHEPRSALLGQPVISRDVSKFSCLQLLLCVIAGLCTKTHVTHSKWNHTCKGSRPHQSTQPKTTKRKILQRSNWVFWESFLLLGAATMATFGTVPAFT